MSAPGVLVVADASRGALSDVARELLALGRQLADGLGGSLAFLALGAQASDLAADAAAVGADRVCIAPGAERAGYHPEAYAAIVLAACEQLAAQAVLFGHGPLGLDLAPRVAYGLAARWATNCVAARVEAGVLHCQRHEVGGKLQVAETIAGRAVLTLRPKSVDPLLPQPGRAFETLPISVPGAPSGEGVVFVERCLEDGGAAEELERAGLVVTGGLGMGSQQAFEKLGELASALGGTLGASKQAVDRGWMPASRQVGLTGTTVAPKLYVAVGVSGALQHMAGCQKSKMIVAINKDAEAPIFRHARYGVVAKWEDLLPELLARLPPHAS